MYRTFTKLAGNLTSLRHQNNRALSTAHGYLASKIAPDLDVGAADDPNHADSGRKSNAAAIADLKEIESSLFENGARNNRPPIDTRKLLEQFAHKPKRADGRYNSGGGGSRGGSHNKFRKAAPVTPPPSTPPPPAPKPKVKSAIVENTTLGLTYTKLHLNDPWLNTLLLSVKSRKSRSLKHQLLIEGRRLIIEAIQSGLQLDHVLFSDIDQLQLLRPHLPSDARLVKVPQSDLRLWSNLATCPGLMAVFTKPADMETLWQRSGAGVRRPQRLPITVVCDQIREPNNVGSVIRNCAAAGCEQVIVTKGCADPWESKALRGGAGAQFKLPVRGPCEWSSVPSMLPEENCFVYLAENSRENATDALRESTEQSQRAMDLEPVRLDDVMRAYSEVRYGGGKHCVVVVGGETEGLSADAYRLLRRNVLGNCVQIPLAAEVESLNSGAALAVILFEIRRQMLAEAESDA